jgi:hypothetical protein
MSSSSSSRAHHEQFEELAALAVIGELSAPELEHLRSHLEVCSLCKEVHEGFANVALNDLGSAVAKYEADEESRFDRHDVEAIQQLGRLRQRLQTGDSRLVGLTTPLTARAVPRNTDIKLAPRLPRYVRAAYGIAAALILSATVATGIAFWRSAKAISAERARSQQLQSVVDSLLQEKKDARADTDNSVLRSLEQGQRERDALQKSLADSEARSEKLLSRESTSQEDLARVTAATEQLRQQLVAKDGDVDRFAKLQRESEVKLREALTELYQARQAPVQITTNGEAHDNANIDSAAQPSSDGKATPGSPSEVEARNLFGARDLHIVDVYDVTGDGKTKRTYGRVYYVEKKLLVFYAFDLENRQNHKRGVFQAWGYREANLGKPLNLGLFSIDDNPTSRWVLTVNRPDVLSHIDAVFVTVEPPGGSNAPSGKKVLYANLVGPPNHP